MSIMYEHGWLLLVLSEGLTWLVAVLFLVGRYWFALKRLSQWCLLFIILCNIFQALLAGIDYYVTGEVSVFQVVVILFVIYACTLGSGDFQRLDQYLRQIFKKYRGKTAKHDPYENQVETQEDTRIYIRYRLRLFSMHTIAFVMLNMFWYSTDSISTNFSMEQALLLLSEWCQHPHEGFFNTPALNIASYVWGFVYLYDVLMFLIYSFLWHFKKR